jgi:uncharacterized membrane protein
MNKMFKILEIIWLAMGCIGIVMCVYSLVIKDNRGAIYFLGFFVVCGIMYTVRKRQRRNFENNQKRNEQLK